MFTKKRILIGIVTAGLIGLIAVGGYVGYIYISGGSGEASTDIENVVQHTACQDVDVEETSSQGCFAIVAEESEVRFRIGEEYSGVDITVIGATNQVGGEILVDVENPANSFIGPITINLRTLQTDIEIRDRAIRGQILKSVEPEYEFTDFVPTEIVGLPDEVNIGVSFSFTVIGDMRLVDITNTLTFTVTITPLSEDRLEGFATTTIDRRDYNLIDFSPPRQVGGVENEVELQIEFIAERVEA